MNPGLKNFCILARNAIFHFLYKYFLKPVLFLFDPEDVHNWFLNIGRLLGRYSVLRWKTRVCFGFSDPILEQTVAGLHFKNPVGLAAGFDKNAEIVPILSSVGFGFAEVGSVTGELCSGNPRPRLWRLPKSGGLVVHYGLKNNGCEQVSDRLRKYKYIGDMEMGRAKGEGNFGKGTIGVSVAMTNIPENMDVFKAVDDYAKAFSAFVEVADYITVNISCPNTLGGMPFLEPENLDALLARLDAIQTDKPVFVKMSPDKSFAEVDAILEILKKHKISGIICSNLTKKPQNPLIFDKNAPNIGGISGKPMQKLSDDLISYIYKREGRRFILIGCGGIFSAEDAYRKIRAGATLVQLITGMIFEGPQLISEINLGLVRLLRRDGLQNISEAIGADHNLRPKVIACDLDGTLTESKSNLTAEMADVLCEILKKYRLAVISGASYKQFQKQFLAYISCGGEVLQNLFLFPANGTACYQYDNLNNAWQVYDEKMTDEEKQKIFKAFEKAIAESHIIIADHYGELVEDRGGQVTFSGCGQDAPLDVKEKWDPDQTKRRKIVELLEKEIPQFEIKIGGATSIDVTHKGIDKAYAIGKIEHFLKVEKEDIIFVGDALFAGGNDSSAKKTGVKCVSVSGPKDTEKVLRDLL